MKIKHYSFFVLSLWPFLWCFFIYFLYDDEVNLPTQSYSGISMAMMPLSFMLYQDVNENHEMSISMQINPNSLLS